MFLTFRKVFVVVSGKIDDYGEDALGADAPGAGENPRPLLPWAATNESETQTHLITIMKVDGVHVQAIAVLPSGTDQKTLLVKRSPSRPNWLII